MMSIKRIILVFAALSFFTSCSKTLGWGVLLWYTDDPPLPSGTILPVFVRSNIDQTWIAGIPNEYRWGDRENFEIPLSHLELAKTKRAAEKIVGGLGEYLYTYAEVLQDGLPVRDKPENDAQRTYRLKMGEVVKVIGQTEGVSAMGTAGSPLDGEWLKILTENGFTGYCFSLRLRLFEHETGPFPEENREIDTGGDADLEQLISRAWYPESWGTMVSSGKIDVEELSEQWGFESGTSSGMAKIILANTDLRFPYTGIKKEPNRSWSFEGSGLRVSLRSETNMLAQYEDENGRKQSVSFVTLPETTAALINRENERRALLFQKIYSRGPSFYSVNYGTITFMENMRFNWGTANLPGGILSESALGSGIVSMGRYLEGESAKRYDGAFALLFDTVGGKRDEVTFLYSLESQGIRLEYVAPSNIRKSIVTPPSSSPLIIYFSTGIQD
jgi:hypothetical protein